MEGAQIYVMSKKTNYKGVKDPNKKTPAIDGLRETRLTEAKQGGPMTGPHADKSNQKPKKTSKPKEKGKKKP